MGEIISFYSYKGGVGRSMALANLSTLLAQRGHRVLAVDFDLEAPGLHRYFLGSRPDTNTRRTPSGPQKGVIDLFVNLRQQTFEHPGLDLSIVASLLNSDDFGYSVRIDFPDGTPSVSLDFLSAGLFDEGYAERVHDFPWSQFYEERSDIFSELIKEWKNRYDYILVDSRTGISDLGSVSTLILADKVVLAFTPNQQSLQGVSRFGRQAVELKRRTGDTRELKLFPLLSRVDEGEQALKRHWTSETAGYFEALFSEIYQVQDINFSSYFEAVQIPHRGYYAYGEKIAVEEERTSTLGSLAEGYSRFLDCLKGEALSGWQERIGNPVKTKREDGALILNFDTVISHPDWIASNRVVSVPRRYDRRNSKRLREIPIDVEAWSEGLQEIDAGLERTLRETTGAIHVFAALPYPAAVYLGRRLDELARAKPVHIYQSSRYGDYWRKISGADLNSGEVTEPHNELLTEAASSVTNGAVLLAIEGIRPADREAFGALAKSLDAHAYRWRPASWANLGPDKLPQAAANLHHALVRLQTQHPDVPLHVVATAPIALLIEFGRLLSPTASRSVVIYQFVHQDRRYAPVLDVMSRFIFGMGHPP